MLVVTVTKSTKITSKPQISIAKHNTYEKNRNPSEPNVVKRYSPLERVRAPLRTVRVILIPVNARRVGRVVVREWFGSLVAD